MRAASSVITFLSTLALALLMAVFWLASSGALRTFVLTLVQPPKAVRETIERIKSAAAAINNILH